MDYIRQEPSTGKNYLSEVLAHASLKIGAIALNAQNPFQWASGYRMPIYNDNRMLLGDYRHRNVTTDAFSDIIDNNDIELDYILGTSLAGIAPASSIATRLGKPLIILNDGKAYEIKHDFIEGLEKHLLGEAEVIASTVPWSIHSGVTIANILQKPFIYIRPAKKDHGKQKQVEGILLPGQRVGLLNLLKDDTDNYDVSAMDAIRYAGGRIHSISTLQYPVLETDIANKKVLVIEDLISTGGSSAKEVAMARSLGAKTDDIISIFTYSLDEAAGQFTKLVPGCRVHSILTYDTLLEVAGNMGYLNQDDEILLKEWRKDPFNWGEKHGFPKAEKK